MGGANRRAAVGLGAVALVVAACVCLVQPQVLLRSPQLALTRLSLLHC